MSTKEGRRTPNPTDVVESTSDNKRKRSRSRLLAPILLGIALALGGGERNGADAQFEDRNEAPIKSRIQINTSIPLDYFELFTDSSGRPLTESIHIDLGVREDGIEQSIRVGDIESLKHGPEEQVLIDEIEKLCGCKVIVPVDLALVPSLKKIPPENLKDNQPLTKTQLLRILKGVQNMPPSFFREDPEIGDNLMPWYLVFNNLKTNGGMGGVNSFWLAEDGSNRPGAYITFFTNPLISLDTPLAGTTLLDDYGQVLEHAVMHEIGHTENRKGSKGVDRHIVAVGWKLIDGKWTMVPPDTCIPGSSDARKGPAEDFVELLSLIGVKPENLLDFPPKYLPFSVHEKLFDGWSHVWENPIVAPVYKREKAKPTATVTPTETPTSTPSPTKPTPETFTVFLPISHSGERINATPEPEGRFGRGSNLSDARRFNPNYENRRNNRKGR